MLSELPLGEVIAPLLDAPSLAALAACSSSMRDLALQPLAWQNLVSAQWGLVASPPPSWSWRRLALYLDAEILPCLDRTRSVASAVKALALRRIIEDEATAWFDLLRTRLKVGSLMERRRIAAFVCAEWHPRGTLAAFLAPITDVYSGTPDEALRALLFHFPFLPIDAGSGADRVIGYFALQFTRHNRAGLACLGVGVGPMSTPGSGSSSSSDDDHPDNDLPSRLPPHALPHEKLARDAVYTLVYSIIMLNTDLHNPMISPKITRDEYAASCRRCVPLRHLQEEELTQIYQRIKANPLRISAGARGAVVGSVVRSSRTDDDSESGASLSIYSRHSTEQLEEYIRAATAQAGAPTSHIGEGWGGGGFSAAPATPAPAVVRVDWNVAYWNLVDASRYLRAATWRALVKPSTAVVAVLVVLVAAAMANLESTVAKLGVS
jgi:hypothetical protein